MSGVDPSRLVDDLRSSLAAFRQTLGSGGQSEDALGLSWEELLSRELSTLEGEDAGPPASWPSPNPAGSVPRLVQSQLPPFPSLPWADALSALKAWGEERAAGPVGQPNNAAVQPVKQGGRSTRGRSPEGLVPDQFDPSLSPQEAYAACGPAAAVAFARASGHDLSLRQVVDLAKTVGWTPAGGMNGIANQKRLLDKMGVPAQVDSSGDWNRVIQQVSSGELVTISTPGHYFVADRYDPKTGRFHVGASGTAYRNGKEWMTRQEMESLAGPINGSLAMEGQRGWKA